MLGRLLALATARGPALGGARLSFGLCLSLTSITTLGRSLRLCRFVTSPKVCSDLLSDKVLNEFPRGESRQFPSQIGPLFQQQLCGQLQLAPLSQLSQP